jgi:hypothetical protein
MKTLTLLFSCIIFLHFTGCKSTGNSISSVEQPAPVDMSKHAFETTENDKPMHEEAENKTICRLLISFISIGEGTDYKARPVLDEILKSWENKTGKTFTFNQFPWGREGEVDFCFQLSELKEKDQEAFVSDVQNSFKNNSLVQISERQASPYQR